jgi:hypothetical protein
MEPIQDFGHRTAHGQINVAMAPYKWPKSNKRSGIWFLFLHFPVEEMFKKKNHTYIGDPSLPEHIYPHDPRIPPGKGEPRFVNAFVPLLIVNAELIKRP